MAATDEEARAAILRHHEALLEGVRARVAALSGPSADGGTSEAARAGLLAYLASEILTHAAAEEATLYPAAARTGLGPRVEEMTAEHRRLQDVSARLAGTEDPGEAAGLARDFEELFSLHVAAENDVVLPALMAAPDVSLAGLLARMQEAYGAARSAISAPSVPAPGAVDTHTS